MSNGWGVPDAAPSVVVPAFAPADPFAAPAPPAAPLTPGGLALLASLAWLFPVSLILGLAGLAGLTGLAGPPGAQGSRRREYGLPVPAVVAVVTVVLACCQALALGAVAVTAKADPAPSSCCAEAGRTLLSGIDWASAVDGWRAVGRWH